MLVGDKVQVINRYVIGSAHGRPLYEVDCRTAEVVRVNSAGSPIRIRLDGQVRRVGWDESIWPSAPATESR